MDAKRKDFLGKFRRSSCIPAGEMFFNATKYSCLCGLNWGQRLISEMSLDLSMPYFICPSLKQQVSKGIDVSLTSSPGSPNVMRMERKNSSQASKFTKKIVLSRGLVGLVDKLLVSLHFESLELKIVVA